MAIRKSQPLPAHQPPESTILQTRWFMYEYTPAYTESGYYGQDISAKSVRVGDFVTSKEEAIELMNEYEPTVGSELRIGFQNLRSYTVESWVAY